MGIETVTTLALIAAVGGVATSAISASRTGKAKGFSVAPLIPPTPADGKKVETDEKRQLQKLALISTSTQGVLGPSPTGRRKLLGN